LQQISGEQEKNTEQVESFFSLSINALSITKSFGASVREMQIVPSPPTSTPLPHILIHRDNQLLDDYTVYVLPSRSYKSRGITFFVNTTPTLYKAEKIVGLFIIFV